MNATVFSTEFDGLELPARYLALAMSYMRAAISLCRAMVDASTTATFPDACVVIWLARHGTELFYKGCIVTKTGALAPRPKSSSGHNLPYLESLFRQHFPSSQFVFDPPVGESLVGDGFTTQQLSESKRFSNRTQERYRYPTQLHGDAFEDVQAITPALLVDVLSSALEQMIAIADAIQAK